jgi:hypothetical protein
MSQQRYGQQPRPAAPGVAEPEPGVAPPDLAESEPDFAAEHSSVSLAGDRPDGPERVPDESVPRGLAGADPTIEE